MEALFCRASPAPFQRSSRSSDALKVCHRLAAVSGEQGLERVRVNRTRQQSGGTVTEQDVDAARVVAAEATAVPQRGMEGYVDVFGFHPRDVRSHGFADDDRVAGAIGDAGHCRWFGAV